MGFGYLLVGYLFFVNPGVYDGFTNVIGYLFAAYGLSTLRLYNKPMRYAYYAMLPLLLIGAADFVLTGGDFLALFTVPESLNTALALLTLALRLLFTVLMFYGIEMLAKETNLHDVRAAAVRNRFFSYLYFVLAIALEIPVYAGEMAKIAAHASLPVAAFGFVVILLNSHNIFNCFRWICRPEDLSPPNEDEERQDKIKR